MSVQLLPLGFLEVGHQAVVKNIDGSKTHRTKLAEMGFVLGSQVCTIRNDGLGPLVVSVMDSRIAMGRGMAQKILVEENA